MKIPSFMLPHRATIVPFKGSGAYGPVWETDETKFKKNVPCLIEPKIRQRTDNTGTDVTQRAEGIFPPDVGIQANDKIIWSENGAEYKVIEWNPINMLGPYSVEVVMT
jgi:hypothetical protein